MTDELESGEAYWTRTLQAEGHDKMRDDIVKLRRFLSQRAHEYWHLADTATGTSDEHRAMHRHLADGYKDCYHRLGKILGIPWYDERFSAGWEAGRPSDEPRVDLNTTV